MRSIKHLLGMVDTRLKLLIARLRSTHDLLQDKYPLLPPLAIIVIVSFAVYYNALSNSFVSDDIYQIVKNPWIKDPHYIPQIFSSNVWAFLGLKGLNYYRPFVFIIYMITYQFFGLEPWAFHGVNILFHAGTSSLVFLIAAQLLASDQKRSVQSSMRIPFLVALLFATHPAHTEPVDWVAGLAELSFTFFSLLAWYLVMRADNSLTTFRGWRALSLVSFALALFCKETAVTLLIILFAYDYLFQRKKLTPLDFVKRHLPYLVVVAGYLLVRFYALGGFAPHRLHSELTPYQDLINVAPLFSLYLAKLLLPLNLNAFHVLHPVMSFFESKMITSLAAVAVVVAVARASWGRNRLVFFSIILLVVPLAPVLYIPVVGLNTFAERYLYLPSLGYVMLLSSVTTWPGLRQATIQKAITVILVIIVCLYSVGTVMRNFDWRNDLTIDANTLKKSPDIAEHHKYIGTVLFAEGLTDEAITNFQLAVAFDHADADLYNRLGAAFVKQGRLDDAIASYNNALLLKPDSAQIHNSLGSVLAGRGEVDDAISQYRIAISLQPSYAGAHNNLGNALMAKGLTDLAIAEYQLALASDPFFADAQNNLGVAYAKKGAIQKAIAQFESALRLNPSDAGIRSNLEQAQKKLSHYGVTLPHLQSFHGGF